MLRKVLVSNNGLFNTEKHLEGNNALRLPQFLILESLLTWVVLTHAKFH